MTRGALQYVTKGQLIDAAYPPEGWWEDYPACGRYTSSPVSNPKNITQREIDRAAEKDHGFLWFVEQSEQTPINSFTEDDRKLADVASQMAEDFGVAWGTPFMFAVDTDGRAYMDNVRAAFVTYRERVPTQFPCGAYAGSDIIDQLIADGTIQYGHIPAALSWSSTSRPVDNVEVFVTRGVRWYRTPNAQLLQYPSQAYRGGRVDPNDVLGAMPVWFPGRTNTQPQPIPNPGGTELPTIITVTGVMELISPTPPPTHVSAFWVRTEAETNAWIRGDNGPVSQQTISPEQCKGIRLSGPCPDNLKPLFHEDSPFAGTQGIKGDKGDPGPSPKSATFTY